MLKSRFELFTALSLAVHGGFFASMFVHVRHPAPLAASSGATPGGAAAVGGETFEVPDIEEAPEQPAPAAEGAPIELDERDPTPQATPADAPGPRESRHARPPPPGGPRAAKGAPSEPPPPLPLYGAVGDRSAGDLVATFKRVFPIAASSDPLWEHVPVGFYADGDVTFFLDEGGSLTHTTASAAAAPAFRAAIARTTQLLRHRLFTARGATTRLHMIVRVTDHLVNHGAFTIDAAGSFELPSGRHVSVAIVER